MATKPPDPPLSSSFPPFLQSDVCKILDWKLICLYSIVDSYRIRIKSKLLPIAEKTLSAQSHLNNSVPYCPLFEGILLILPSKHIQSLAIVTTCSTLLCTTIISWLNEDCLKASISSSILAGHSVFTNTT